MSVSAQTRIDARRRPTLPREVMEQAGIEPGDVVEVRFVEPGRIELITRRLLIAHAIDELQRMTGEVEGDGVEDLLQMRREDRALFDARFGTECPDEDSSSTATADRPGQSGLE